MGDPAPRWRGPGEGTTAGVGDLVQARRNAWDLAGYQGNPRGPINRETYRVVAIAPDGGLVADHADGAGRIALPAAYAAEHLTLDYASTVHSAQGRTLDTAHAVISPRTGAAAAYVALTRGRESNAAYVTTITVPEDSPPGQASTVDRRNPCDILADVMEREQDDRSALQLQVESWSISRSARTAGDRIADAADMVSAMRTATILDRLTAAGTLTGAQRRQLAADEATGQLGRLLRRVELAGHDAEAELNAAAARPLEGAASIASVLHGRLETRLAGRLAPQGDTFASRTPKVDDLVWRQYLSDLAEVADQRARELGADTAQDPPRWARESLGPVPADPVERLAWEQRAGQVAAYREMAGHEDEVNALGPAPKAGKVEHHAAWHAAWRALGRPEAGRDEAEMSDGQLLVRIRAYQREEIWAPAYVADDLDGTTREAIRRRQDAILQAARAEQVPDADRKQLHRRATGDAAIAELLDERVRQLRRADEARATWYVHTAETRAAADRARIELIDRGVDPNHPADAVSPADWLATHHAAMGADDTHRAVTEAELADECERRALPVVEPVIETAVADIREAAEPPPVRADEGTGRVATAEETAAAVERAQRALIELQARAAAERARAEEEVAQIEHARRRQPDALGSDRELVAG